MDINNVKKNIFWSECLVSMLLFAFSFGAPKETKALAEIFACALREKYRRKHKNIIKLFGINTNICVLLTSFYGKKNRRQ